MVFFNCNACGEALKKSAVEKHYLTKCRQCEVLSCVDCGKDFWGDDYQQHVKCISEEEKYSGKDYKPKPNQNKGERKQELWIQQVQEAVQKASGNSSLRSILQKLVDYPNIPRKQAKFENFLKNSLRIHNSNLVKQVWTAMSASMNKPAESQTNGNATTDDKTEKTDTKSSENDDSQNDSESSKPKNKRERKEERREKATKKQKKDKNLENGDKKRKRKHEEAEEEEEEVAVKKSKKKKKSHVEDEIEPKVDQHQEEPEEEPAPEALTPGKFRWEATIVAILRKHDDKELPLKKLRKKVLNEYFSRVAEKNRLSEEQLWAKFDKKVTKNGQFKVHKERVKLVK